MTQQLVARAPDGIHLAVSLHGEGPRTLLMIPGMGAARTVYDPVVPLLARRLRVVVFDPRGIGESEMTDGPYTMEQLAGDAAAVLDTVGVDRAAVWGASMGGMVAQHLALRHPQRLDALFLACTTPGGVHAIPATPEALAALAGKGGRTPGEAYRIACTVLYSPAFRAAHLEVIDAAVAYRERHPVRARVWTAQSQAAARHDTYDVLPRITAPTLVLHGTDDAVMPLANGVLLADRIPGARRQWLPGRGHLFFHEDPEATVRAVEGFLTS